MIRDLQYQSYDKKSGFRLQYFYRLGLELDAGKQSLVFVFRHHKPKTRPLLRYL
jgi:hypothetical protein